MHLQTNAFDTKAVTFDSTGSGHESIPNTRKSFTKEAGKVNVKALTFDAEADTFGQTDSSLKSIPSSQKQSPNSRTPPASLAPLGACSSCERDVLVFAEHGVTIHMGCGDLTSDETKHLLKLLEAVADVLYWREEDEELIGMIHTMMDRLLDNDTAEIADDARHPSPSQHLVRERPTQRFHGGRHRR